MKSEKEEKKIKGIKQKHFRKTIEKKRICYKDDCTLMSINSHILQKNGYLSNISENSHVTEIGDFAFKEKRFQLRDVGIKNAFSFWGFCNSHDTEIFKAIETDPENIDFESYKVQFLLSYRGALNQIQKKEICIDTKERWLNDPLLKDKIDVEKIEENIFAEKLAIIEGHHWLNRFKNDMESSSSNSLFKFHTVRLPFIPICSSSVFTYETTEEINKMVAEGNEEDILTDIFFNLIPLQTESIFIIGYPKERESTCGEYIKSIITGDTNEILTDICSVIL